jgi:hypothetical protein
MTTILEYASPAVIACDKRATFAQGSEATTCPPWLEERRRKQSIYPRARKVGLLRFARNDGNYNHDNCWTVHLIALQFLNSRCECAVSSPEMAHFFAQNIIAPCELFSEN